MTYFNKVTHYLSLFVALAITGLADGCKDFEKPLLIKAVVVNNAFACDLYSELKAKEGNILFSPYSISSALTMTYLGAEGNTKKEMAKVLHLPKKIKDFLPSVAYLSDELKQRETFPFLPNPTILHIANSLWVEKEFSLEKSFLKANKKYFGVEVASADFSNKAEESYQVINRWVEKETQGKIVDLLSPNDVNSATRLVLVSAIYMKGDWYYSFDPNKTTEAPFYLDADLEPTPLTVMPPSVDVPLMSNTDGYRYYKGDDFSMVELPYQFSTPTEAQLSCLVVLPDEVRGLKELEKKLTADNIADWIQKLEVKNVQVEIPKFKTTQSLELNEVLSKMGMQEAFTPQADFSSMTGGKDLMINAVVHKAFIAVDEKGTEAAAATGVSMNLTSMLIPEDLTYFRADRSFIYMIADMHTGTILFMGRMAQP